jgi:hypothetical protein
MLKAIALLTLSVLGTLPAKSSEFPYYIDGNKLWWACQFEQPYAYGIIAGIHDALSESYSKTGGTGLQVCAPEGYTVPMLKKTICQDLEDHPNIRNSTAVQVVWTSMLINYPCP